MIIEELMLVVRNLLLSVLHILDISSNRLVEKQSKGC